MKENTNHVQSAIYHSGPNWTAIEMNHQHERLAFSCAFVGCGHWSNIQYNNIAPLSDSLQVSLDTSININ